MKNILRTFAGFAVLISILCFISPAHAADVIQPDAAALSLTPAPATTGAIDAVLQTVADALMGKFGWAAKLFSVLGVIAGACRFAVKPLWAFVVPKLEEYVSSTPDKADDERLHAFLGNPLVKGFLFVLDALCSVKIPTPPAK